MGRPKTIITKSELAKELGLSRARITQLSKRDDFPGRPDGRVDRAKALAWYHDGGFDRYLHKPGPRPRKKLSGSTHAADRHSSADLTEREQESCRVGFNTGMRTACHSLVSAFREFFPQMLLDQGVIEGFSTQDHAMLERLDAVAIADILLTDLAQEPLAKAPPLSPLEFGQTLNDADKKIAANAIAEIQRIWRSSEPPEPGNVPIPDGKFPVISRGGDE